MRIVTVSRTGIFIFHWQYRFFSQFFPLMFFFSPLFPHSTVSFCNCSTLLLISFISPQVLLFTSPPLFIFFTFSSPCFSYRFLGLIMLICWLKEIKIIVTGTRKQPNLFASRQTHKCACICAYVLQAMADIRKGKIPCFFPAPSLCLAWRIIRSSRTGPCPPLCHICVLSYTFLCVCALCVFACVCQSFHHVV